MPTELVSMKAADFTGSANDVLAVIKLNLKVEDEGAYRSALEYLCAVVEFDAFPQSFAIEFRGPTKMYVPHLPKKGVNQLFACAAQYPALRRVIERYARAVMREDAWYFNIPEENPAMPGTFAVAALVLADDAYVPLAIDYLDACDDEHQYLQAGIMKAYVDQRGMSADAIDLLVSGVQSMQEFPPQKSFAVAAANTASLKALDAARQRLLASHDDADWIWRSVIYAIWGKPGLDKPANIVKKAPPELAPLYSAVLTTESAPL